MKKETEVKTENTNVVNTVAGAVQETALATLNATVKTQQVAEQYAQGIAKLGFNAAQTGLEVVQAYWNSLAEIRQAWVTQAATGAEKVLATDFVAAATAYQQTVVNYGQELATRTQKAYSAFTEPVTVNTK